MNRWKLLAAAGLLAAVMLMARVLPLAAWTIQFVDTIRDAGLPGVALYVLVYAVSTVALVPGSIMTMVAGFVYGPIVGLTVAVPGALIGAAAAFLLGRTVFRERVRRAMARSPKVLALDAAMGREGFKLVLLLRLSPLVPFSALNYALSMSGITLRTFVFATLLGKIPGSWLYVYLGSLVTTAAQLSAGSAPPSPLRTAFYAAGLAATVTAVVVSGRIAKRALEGAVEAATPNPESRVPNPESPKAAS